MPQVHENIASNHDLSFGRWLRRVPPHAGAGLVPLQSQPSPPIAGAGLVPALNNVPTCFKICRTLFVGRHKTGPCDASVTCRTWIPYNGFVLSSYPSLMGYKEYLRISISTKYYFLRYSPIFFISAPCAVGGSPLFKFRKLIITFQPSLPHYFMRFSAILCKAIFVIGRLLPR